MDTSTFLLIGTTIFASAGVGISVLLVYGTLLRRGYRRDIDLEIWQFGHSWREFLKIMVQDPELRAIVILGTIFHRFDLEMIRGVSPSPDRDLDRLIDMTEKRFREVVARIPFIEFSLQHKRLRYSFSRLSRKLIVDKLANEDRARFIEYNEWAAQVLASVAMQVESHKRLEIDYERCYHLLISKGRAGLELFEALFNQAFEAYRFDLCHSLVELAQEASPFILSTMVVEEIHYRQARLLWDERRWRKASEILTRLAQKSESEVLRAKAMSSLGAILQFQGFPERAALLEFQAWRIFETQGDDYHSAWTLFSLAQAVGDLHYHIEAIAFLNKSLALWEECKFVTGCALALDQLGFVNLALHRHDLALINFNKAIELRKSLNDEFGLAWSTRHLGLLYKELGRKDRSAVCYRKAARGFANVHDSFAEAKSQTTLALALMRLGARYADESIRAWKRAVSLAKLLGNEIGVGRNRTFAFLYLAQLRLPELAMLLLRALIHTIRQKVRPEINPEILAKAKTLPLSQESMTIGLSVRTKMCEPNWSLAQVRVAAFAFCMQLYLLILSICLKIINAKPDTRL